MRKRARTCMSGARRSCCVEGQPLARMTRCPSTARVTHERTPGSPFTFSAQLGQSPVRQYSPRGLRYLNERAKMRTPARYNADAIVSPASMTTRRPSNSSDAMDLVGACVALDRQHATTTREMKPSFALHARDVLADPHAFEIRL